MSVAYKLYELAEQYNLLADMLDQTDDPQLIQDTLDAVEGQFEQKVESIIKLWRSKCAERDIVKSEIFRLQAIVNRLDKQATWLHDYVEAEMKHAGIQQVKSPLFKIALQKNPPAVDVLNEDIIPEQYKLTVVDKRLDKKAIKAAIDAGEEVPGAALRQEISLRVR